jgi:hypothetical protein
MTDIEMKEDTKGNGIEQKTEAAKEEPHDIFYGKLTLLISFII